jgi:hypothetical protein
MPHADVIEFVRLMNDYNDIRMIEDPEGYVPALEAFIAKRGRQEEMLESVVAKAKEFAASCDADEAEPAVEVEVVTGVEPEPAEKCTVTGCDGGRLFEDGIEVSLCGACHPEAFDEELDARLAELDKSSPVDCFGLLIETHAAPVKPKPKLDFVVVKPAPKNKRSKIGEVRQATPEAIAALNAKLAEAA